jgi:transcriptional regulator with XRE-family HTH domain
MKVRPAVLRQLRELAGYTQEQVLKEGIDVAKLESSDGKYIEVDLKTLQKLSKLYDFSLSIFFLSVLPYTLEDINKKFITSIQLGTDFTRRILKLYRKCIYLRDSVSDYNDRRQEPNRYTLKDDPKEVAEKEGDNIIFGNIRYNLEEKYCIYVFNISVIGDRLVLTDEKPYIIAVGSLNDNSMYSMYDLLHCYGHVLLRISFFCRFNEKVNQKEEADEIERWCDAFASALIEKYNDIRTVIHKYGRNYIKALSTLDHRLDELTDILGVKVDVVKKVMEDSYRF